MLLMTSSLQVLVLQFAISRRKLYRVTQSKVFVRHQSVTQALRRKGTDGHMSFTSQ